MIPEIDAPTLQQKLLAGEKVLLLDVRGPGEYQLCALPDSVLIPLHELAERFDEVPKSADSLLVVYCHHGIRSRHAVAFLAQQGVTQACSLQGGIDAWSMLVDPTVPRY